MPFKYYVTMYSAIRKISCGVRLDNNCILSSFFYYQKYLIALWSLCSMTFLFKWIMLLLHKIYVLQEREIGHKIYVLILIVPCRYVFQYLVSYITYLISLPNEEIKCIKGVVNKVLMNDYGSGVKSNVIYGRMHIYYMSGPIWPILFCKDAILSCNRQPQR